MYTISSNDKCSAIRFNDVIDNTKDFFITFEYAYFGYALSAAHGFCLSLINSNTEYTGGGGGPALGVATLQALSGGVEKIFQGLSNSLLSIGFDSYGLFGTDQLSPFVNGFTTPQANSITVRAGADFNYDVLYRTDNLASSAACPEPFSLFTPLTGTPPSDYLKKNGFLPDVKFRTFRLRVTELGRRIILEHKIKDSFSAILDTILPQSINNSVYPLFSWSCGEVYTESSPSPLIDSTLILKNVNANAFFLTPTPTATVTPTISETPAFTPTPSVTPEMTPSQSVHRQKHLLGHQHPQLHLQFP